MKGNQGMLGFCALVMALERIRGERVIALTTKLEDVQASASRLAEYRAASAATSLSFRVKLVVFVNCVDREALRAILLDLQKAIAHSDRSGLDVRLLYLTSHGRLVVEFGPHAEMDPRHRSNTAHEIRRACKNGGVLHGLMCYKHPLFR